MCSSTYSERYGESQATCINDGVAPLDILAKLGYLFWYSNAVLPSISAVSPLFDKVQRNLGDAGIFSLF